jgi:hypothetical protein
MGAFNNQQSATHLLNNVSMITNLPTASTAHLGSGMNYNRYITPYVPIFLLRNKEDRIYVEPHEVREAYQSRYEQYSFALSLMCINDYLRNIVCPDAQGAVQRNYATRLAANKSVSEYEIEQRVRAYIRSGGDGQTFDDEPERNRYSVSKMASATAQGLMQQIDFAGIQGTQANLVEGVDKSEEAYNLSSDEHPPVLSLVQRNMTYAMNLWPGARGGQHVYFLLKRTHLVYRTQTERRMATRPEELELDRDQSNWSHFQFVPYTCTGLNKSVDYQDTLYLGYGGQIEHAIPIYVGMVAIDYKADLVDEQTAMRAAGCHIHKLSPPTLQQSNFSNNDINTVKIVVNPCFLGDYALKHV